MFRIMTSPADPAALIARLSALSGPDREVANEVLFACGWTMGETGDGPDQWPVWFQPGGEFGCMDGDQPNPLSSIDAAMGLMSVLPGWEPHLLAFPHGGPRIFTFEIFPPTGHPQWSKGSIRGHGNTAEFAIVSAILRAKETERKDA